MGCEKFSFFCIEWVIVTFFDKRIMKISRIWYGEPHFEKNPDFPFYIFFTWGKNHPSPYRFITTDSCLLHALFMEH